ncbi:MAG: urease accessory protein UreF [Bacteroidota bacterium]
MNNALLSLLHLSDPALPIGGYSHSAGLETYVQSGIVKDAATAKEFVTEMLSKSIHYTDATSVSLAYDAAGTNDLTMLLSLDEECTAVKLPREMREASRKIGWRVIKNFQPLCNNNLLNEYAKTIKEQEASGHYCIAFGLLANILNIPKKDTLTGFYYNAAAGFITNSVKLIPLSQQHGQEILFSLHPLIEELAEKNLQPDRDLIGLCCSGFDIRSMQHERLYSRLYMS